MEPIGIRKSISTRIWLTGFLLFACSLLCIVFWALYKGNYAAEWWLNNGVEVKATGVKWGEGYIWRDYSDGHSYREHYYYCQFEYESEDGKLYVVKPRYKYRETAEASVGTQRKILIDPNGTEARIADYEYLTPHFAQDLAVAIIFTVPIPILYYLFIYRAVYRGVVNHIMCERVGEEVKDFVKPKSINDNTTALGEVVRIKSWIVSYVKVRYYDKSGIVRERWAHEWFTRREAEFLKEKKYITIVPYKGIYGILEEMPTVRKLKKSKNYE